MTPLRFSKEYHSCVSRFTFTTLWSDLSIRPTRLNQFLKPETGFPSPLGDFPKVFSLLDRLHNFSDEIGVSSILPGPSRVSYSFPDLFCGGSYCFNSLFVFSLSVFFVSSWCSQLPFGSLTVGVLFSSFKVLRPVLISVNDGSPLHSVVNL